jgi:nicotinate-nucleotide adenylyltransferase
MSRHASKPWAGKGQVIGLLGGSFDPPHAGHVHLTRQAIKQLGLDHVWWLVSPGNPLKHHAPAPLPDRIEAARALMRHPRVHITGIEADLGTRATVDTLRALGRRYPHLRFVWLMGADSLANFHRWARWQTILNTVPIAVFARPGQRLAALTSKTASTAAKARLDHPRALARARAPAWVYLDMPMRKESSSAIRAARKLSRVSHKGAPK